MFIDTKAFNKQQARYVTQTRENCLGCVDCTGPCRALLEISQLPEILLERGDPRT